MAKDPYFRVFPSDFLGGIIDLQGDEIGAYWVVILLMQDRGGPIPDDSEWIARRAGVGRRRWGVIRAKLIELGKIKARAGMLANPRALRDIEKRTKLSETRRSAALARWNADDAPELDLGDDAETEISGNNPQKSAKSTDANASALHPELNPAELREKTEKNREIARDTVQGINEHKPQFSAENDDAHASKDSRARSRPRVQSLESKRTTESESYVPPEDFEATFEAVCKAAGFSPRKPEHIDTAKAQLQGWIDQGLDIERTVLPVIRKTIANSDDPTSSLARFNRSIGYSAARAAAAPAPLNGTPTLIPDDPDERLEQIRIDLRKNLGDRTYTNWLIPVGLTVDGTTLTVTTASAFTADWLQSHLAKPLAHEAKRHGFTRVVITTVPHGQHSGP